MLYVLIFLNEFLFKYIKIKIDNKLQTKNPTNRGSAVEVTKRPIKVLIGTAIIVEINPVIAAPIPAICPTGCIANARRFPNKNPIEKNCSAKKINNTTILGFSF